MTVLAKYFLSQPFGLETGRSGNTLLNQACTWQTARNRSVLHIQTPSFRLEKNSMPLLPSPWLTVDISGTHVMSSCHVVSHLLSTWQRPITHWMHEALLGHLEPSSNDSLHTLCTLRSGRRRHANASPERPVRWSRAARNWDERPLARHGLWEVCYKGHGAVTAMLHALAGLSRVWFVATSGFYVFLVSVLSNLGEAKDLANWVENISSKANFGNPPDLKMKG